MKLAQVDFASVSRTPRSFFQPEPAHMDLMINVLNNQSVESDGSTEFGDLIKNRWVKRTEGGKFKLSLLGRYAFVDLHNKRVQQGEVAEDSIKFILIQLAEYLGGGELDGSVLLASSGAVLETTKSLLKSRVLAVSSRSREFDYAVVDFVDAIADEDYLLFPGDLIVLVDHGYVVHSFGE